MKYLFGKLFNLLTCTKFIERKSDTVFIVGDGNSLNEFDFNELQGYDVISLSFAPMAVSWPSKAPDNVHIALLTSPKWFFPYMPQNHGGGLWRNRANRLFSKRIRDLNFDMLYVSKWSLHKYLFQSKVTAFHSPLLLKGNDLDWSIGGLVYALYLVRVMGYKSIQFVGCDYLAKPTIAGHWFESSKKIPIELDSYLSQYIKVLADLEMVVWTDKQEVVNQTLMKRNYNNLDSKKLRMLSDFKEAIASWNDYSI